MPKRILLDLILQVPGRFDKLSDHKKKPSVSGWLLERKTRLELATPTLARSCSTN